MALVAQNGLWLTREGFARDPLTPGAAGGPQGVLYDGLVQAMASGELRLAAGSNLQVYSAASNVVLGAGGVADVVTVRADGVDIRGAVRVLGTIDAISSSDLLVRDKLVRVSHEASSCNLPDDVLDGAGVALGSAAQRYERSLRWRRGLGASAEAAALAVGATSNEGFWELRGGGLRLSAPRRADGGAGQVSYGMHINEREELVMYKAWSPSPGEPLVYQRVFTFGSTAQPLALPTSANPYYG